MTFFNEIVALGTTKLSALVVYITLFSWVTLMWRKANKKASLQMDDLESLEKQLEAQKGLLALSEQFT